MAKLDRSFVRIRFRFGNDNVKGRQRYVNTAAYMARRIAFQFAEGQYDTLRKTLEQTVERDVRRELVNLASLYRRHIIGADAPRGKPQGVIHSVIGGASPMALSSALPSWAPRNAQYLQRKRNATGHDRWFDNQGWRRYKGQRWMPRDSGLMFREMRADTWETMFGPINVRFYKSRMLTANDAVGNINVSSGQKVRVQVGTLGVYALNKITPDMLPALRTGVAETMASDAGNPGLMELVQKYSEPLAYRLGQRSSVTKRYRPTLEPFLGYFLTRSVPTAVARRIQEGTLKQIVRS